MPKDTIVGTSPKRREDRRFTTGKGRYTDDIVLKNQTYAAFARSEVAHGRIRGIDTSAAEAMPGVLAVFTGEDFTEVGGNPAGWLIHSRDGTPMTEPKRPVLKTKLFSVSSDWSHVLGTRSFGTTSFSV